MAEQQITEARNKAAKDYVLKQGSKEEISSAKQVVVEEQKRQKNIAQTNRLLNKQQITINGIAKSYNKYANPDLDKSVTNPDDLKELSKKKQEIQGLINKLNGQGRDSSNEQEFLQVEKLIAEYKQLAKDKLKANNPSKQQLGGENLKSLLENQVSQYNKLIAESEKYGSVTEEITAELKKQRDLIAEQDKNGVYRARSTKADGSKITADDYYEARDSYKINKSILGSYKTSSPELKKQIATYNELITTIEKYKSSATLIAKGNGTDELDAEVAALQVRIEELQNSPILSKEQLQSARDMLEKIEDKLIEIQGTAAITATKKAEDSLPSYSKTLQSYEKSIKKLQDGGWASPTFISNVNAIRVALKNYEDAIIEVKQKMADGIATQEDIDGLNRYKVALEETINATKGMSSSEKGYSFLAGQKELDKINKILKENSAMAKEAKEQIRAYYDQIKYGNPSASLETIHGEIMEIVNAEVEAGRGGKNLLDVIKDKAWYGLASQIGMYFGLNDFIRYIREGIDVVTELDTALTEMRKVSDETTTSLKAYQETTFDVADAVGTAAVQIQNSTADFMRLGESLDEAAESAKTANILMNVSEFENIDDATSALTSMAQAYQDLDKMTIVDKLNEVGNNYAISTDELATALQDSAATLSLMGNTIDESAALVTTANATIQDSSSVAAGLRTISLRIVGTEEAEEQLSAMDEDVDAFVTATNSKKQQIIKDYTAVASNNYEGFDILDENGNYKNTYDILLGIAQIYQEIVEQDKKLGTNHATALVEELAGKNRSNIASAILQDPQQLEDVLKSSENAAGSATEELNKYLDSVDGRRFCHVA